MTGSKIFYIDIFVLFAKISCSKLSSYAVESKMNCVSVSGHNFYFHSPGKDKLSAPTAILINTTGQSHQLLNNTAES